MFLGWWVINALNIAFCAVAVLLSSLPGHVLRRWRIPLRPADLATVRFLSWTALFVITVVSLVPLAQNFRYLAPIFGCIQLLGGAGLWAIYKVASLSHRFVAYPAYAAVAVLVFMSVNAGYSDFEKLYVEAGIQDLAIAIVLHFPDLKTKWMLRENGALMEMPPSAPIARPAHR
jgi:hypothetical protein